MAILPVRLMGNLPELRCFFLGIENDVLLIELKQLEVVTPECNQSEALGKSINRSLALSRVSFD